jgi:hypothetical protein
MEYERVRELFDTGLKKIRFQIKTLLVPHGLYGTVTDADGPLVDAVPSGSRIEIHAKGRTVGQDFDRQQIEGCHLVVRGAVLASLIAMVNDLSTEPARQPAG